MGAPATLKIAVIGSGNVATHLSRALDAQEGVWVAQVLSRDIEHARRLAEILRDAEAVDSYDRLCDDADLYLVSVCDDAVRIVAQATPDYRGVWAHTSGSVPVDALEGKSRRGVFYPLQTFSRDMEVDMTQVPLLTEASDEDTEARLTQLARLITPRVSHADSALRRRLHVAAVFACNFANYMWTMADDLLRDCGKDLGIFSALLQATLDKALACGPEDAQTGPARRGDTAVIQDHEATLPPAKAEIYRLLSTQILQRYEQD